MSSLSAGPTNWRAPEAGRKDGGLRDRRLGHAPSRITIVPPGVGLYKPPGAPMQRVRTLIELDQIAQGGEN